MDKEYLSASGLTDITAALKKLLADTYTDIDWSYELKGPVMPTKLAGTVTADAIDFEDVDKFYSVGTIDYSIYLIAPASFSDVEIQNLAMGVRKLLRNNDRLGGLTSGGYVRDISFGAAPGTRAASAAIINFRVEALFV